MNSNEIIKKWEKYFDTAFLGERDNPEHISLLLQYLAEKEEEE
tara:strand:- start:292 stop:420 length:129 start_codon:yes stop_codon:yes gene_type:complete